MIYLPVIDRRVRSRVLFSDGVAIAICRLFLGEAPKRTFGVTNGHLIFRFLVGPDTLIVSLPGFKQRNIPVQITPVNPHQMLEILLNEEIAAHKGGGCLCSHGEPTRIKGLDLGFWR